MATSKSRETDRNYTAGVSIFSGRPDPTWPVGREITHELLRLWNDLESHTGPVSSPPPLGYRGVFLRSDASEEWTAYRGVVVFRASNDAQLRSDPNRSFERIVIASAPDGLIPPAALSSEFK